MIKSSFGFAMPAADPAHRLYANDLAGGGILVGGGGRTLAGDGRGPLKATKPRVKISDMADI